MIFFETAGQARGFLLLLYAGFFSGALYDLLRLPRRRLPRPFRPLPDLAWALLTAAACALALAAGGETKARLYALLGLCCGGLIYCLGLRAALGWGRRMLLKKNNAENGEKEYGEKEYREQSTEYR